MTRKKSNKKQTIPMPKEGKWYAYVTWFAANHTLKFALLITLFFFLLGFTVKFSLSFTTKKGNTVKINPIDIQKNPLKTK